MSARNFLRYPAKVLASLAAHIIRTDNPHSVTKAQVGLGNVANLAPVDLPISTAQTNAINAAVAALVASSPATLDTLKEIADALGNDPNFATTITDALAGKAPKASPSFSGTTRGQKTNVSYSVDAFGANGNGHAYFEDVATPSKRLALGYDPVNDIAVFQALHEGVTTKDIAINPSSGNVRLGKASLTTGNVFGTPYMPLVNGTPAVAPNAVPGMAPFLFDSVANKLWVYNGGWKGVTLA